MKSWSSRVCVVGRRRATHNDQHEINVQSARFTSGELGHVRLLVSVDRIDSSLRLKEEIEPSQ